MEPPNTISKVKSMKRHVEDPLVERFGGRRAELVEAGLRLGGEDVTGLVSEADAALELRPLPRVPVLLLFWDEEPEEGYGARVKLLFDETIPDHLDIESIMFLSERIRQLLCGEGE